MESYKLNETEKQGQNTEIENKTLIIKGLEWERKWEGVGKRIQNSIYVA